MDYLFTARPTAVNLGNATRRLSKVLEQQDLAAEELAKKFVAEGKLIADEDVGRNKEMAKWGAEWLVQQVGDQIPEGGLNVMTVCNTGSLATSGKSLIVAAEETYSSGVSGYGTALGLITHLHETGKLRRAFYTQSTPYHQVSHKRRVPRRDRCR